MLSLLTNCSQNFAHFRGLSKRISKQIIARKCAFDSSMKVYTMCTHSARFIQGTVPKTPRFFENRRRDLQTFHPSALLLTFSYRYVCYFLFMYPNVKQVIFETAYLLAKITTDTAEKRTKRLTRFVIFISDSTQSRSHRRVNQSHSRVNQSQSRGFCGASRARRPKDFSVHSIHARFCFYRAFYTLKTRFEI